MNVWYSLRWFDPALWQQFRFAQPLALYLMPAVGLLFLLRYYIQRGAQQRLNMSLGNTAGGRRNQAGSLAEYSARTTQAVVSSLRFLLPTVVCVGAGLLLVSLARPQIVREIREKQSEGIDIILAMDVSSSMTEADLPPSRLVVARRVAQAFVDGRKNDRIGLVVFAGEAFSLCPLTTDYALIKQYLNDMNDRMIPASGTAIGDALARCINRMRESATASADSTRQKSTPSKVIILLSDGDNTAGNLDPVMAARLAKAFGIRIYTIAVGRAVPSETQATTVDEGILKTIASIGNGSFFRATDAGRLRAIFTEINRLEKSPIRLRMYEDVQDYYRIYLYWGISMLLVALFLKITIFGNVLED